MTEKNWKRARSREQVETRVIQILEAAAKLYRSTAYEDVTMLKIATEAGFTRSNIYRYFTSREEIFLSLYLVNFRLWREDIQDTFNSPLSSAQFLSRWIEVLKKNQRLLELTPLLNTSLERNSSREILKKAKQEIAQVSQDILKIIEVVLPALPPESAFEFLQTNFFLIAGAWPACKRTPMQDDVLEELNLQQMKFRFYPYLERVLETYLAGLTSDSE